MSVKHDLKYPTTKIWLTQDVDIQISNSVLKVMHINKARITKHTSYACFDYEGNNKQFSEKVEKYGENFWHTIYNSVTIRYAFWDENNEKFLEKVSKEFLLDVLKTIRR